MNEDYLQANEAAELLGVTRHKLYNLQKNKCIKFTINPMNNYRLYKRSDVEECKKMLKDKTGRKVKPKMFL